MKHRLARPLSFNYVTTWTLILVVLCIPQSLLAFTEQTGSLESYLKSFTYGTKADNQWQEPSAEKMDLFALVMTSFLGGDFEETSNMAEEIGYHLIRFTDTDQPIAKVHYILTEKYTIGDPEFQGGGIYVFFPAGNNFAIEAPHPRSDLNTEKEAVELYIAASSRYLFLAGTRRNSSTEYSECSGRYYKSDAVHNTTSLYQVAHECLTLFNEETVFINLHGFGSNSLSQLQQQCKTTNSNLLNLSEGVFYTPQFNNRNVFMLHLAQQVSMDGLASVCIYGIHTESLGGTYATNGRITNGSADACFENASTSSHKFVHLEQSYDLRSSNRSKIVESIATAIKTYQQAE